MPVEVQDHRSGGVAEHPLHYFDVRAGTDGEGRCSVPQPVRDKPFEANLLAGLVESPPVLTNREIATLTAMPRGRMANSR